MALNTTATFEAGLSWTQTDDTAGNTTDNIGLKTRVTLLNGTGNGQVDTVWLGTGALGSGSGVTFDLYNLSRSVLGGTFAVSFNPGNVKSMYIENTSTGNNQRFHFRNSGAAGFRTISDGSGINLTVFPSGALVFANPVSGSVVDATNRYFGLIDGGLSSTYKLGIVGTTP